jgi:hypothetical protein
MIGYSVRIFKERLQALDDAIRQLQGIPGKNPLKSSFFDVQYLFWEIFKVRSRPI